MRKIRVLGVMTGTSCDGIDLACAEFDRGRMRILWNRSAKYDGSLRDRVLQVQNGQPVALRLLLELDRDLGEWYGRVIAGALRRLGGRDRPDVIANHGQTVAHFPPAPGGGAQGTTLQLGSPARIARATGLTVVSHFRDGDLAAGGQGAPLVPLYHERLARDLGSAKVRRGVAIHNLGGISNFSYFGPRGKVLGFDTGPGGFWIDLAVARHTDGQQLFDRGGRIAAKGVADRAGVERVLRHPFFSADPPKSTGRDAFPFRLLLSATRARDADLVATATEATVESIARAYEKWVLGEGLPLAEIHFCGGGAKNEYLLKRLGVRLGRRALGKPAIAVSSVADSLGLDPSGIEAQAFAYFGYRALQGLSLGGPWTGSCGYAPPAQLTPGSNWARLLGKA